MAAVTRRAFLRPRSFRLTPEATGRPKATGHHTGTWLRVHRVAMACRFEIVLPGEDAGHLPAARAALDEADRLESQLTVYRESSDLMRVNRGAARSPVSVPNELYELLARCGVLHDATDGAFDITSTPLSRCWGFLRREGRLPRQEDIDAARACVRMHDVVLASSTVSFRRPGLELNLGAIGKGFALDRMSAGLRAAGVRTALLSAGRSSVLALGAPRHGWRVDVWSTVRHEFLARLFLRGAALGTSGAGEQFVEVGGVRYGHVIDPRTGWPASGVVSASVVASNAADADALSTAFLVSGLDLARRYCSSHTDVLAIVTPDEHPRRPQVFGAHGGVTVENA